MYGEKCFGKRQRTLREEQKCSHYPEIEKSNEKELAQRDYFNSRIVYTTHLTYDGYLDNTSTGDRTC